jgi:hypothetical protein
MAYIFLDEYIVKIIIHSGPGPFVICHSKYLHIFFDLFSCRVFSSLLFSLKECVDVHDVVDLLFFSAVHKQFHSVLVAPKIQGSLKIVSPFKNYNTFSANSLPLPIRGIFWAKTKDRIAIWSAILTSGRLDGTAAAEKQTI